MAEFMADPDQEAELRALKIKDAFDQAEYAAACSAQLPRASAARSSFSLRRRAPMWNRRLLTFARGGAVRVRWTVSTAREASTTSS
jgi:hypothetical protein